VPICIVQKNVASNYISILGDMPFGSYFYDASKPIPHMISSFRIPLCANYTLQGSANHILEGPRILENLLGLYVMNSEIEKEQIVIGDDLRG
jgi:hypothetical protein